MRRRPLARLLLTSLAVAAAVATLGASRPARALDVHRLSESDWYRHEGSEKQFTEFWTGILQSKDGWIVYVSFLRTNLGLLSGHAGIALSVTAPDGTVTRRKIRYDASSYAEDREKGTITIDAQRMRFDDAGHELHVEFDDVVLDATLTPWTDGYELGDGRRTVSAEYDHYMKYVFLIPRADVRGRLTVDGRTVALEGAGYLDHMVTNRALTLWSRRWYVLNLFADDVTVQFSEGYPLEGHEQLHGRLGWFAVVDHDGVRLATATPTLEFRKKAEGREGCSWPTEFVLTAKNGADRARIAWRTDTLHDPYIVLEQLSWAIRRIIAAVLGNPVFFRFTNDYRMELELGGRTRRIGGHGLHQVVCLHPDT